VAAGPASPERRSTAAMSRGFIGEAVPSSRPSTLAVIEVRAPPPSGASGTDRPGRAGTGGGSSVNGPMAPAALALR
jgi:hypothetical protein